MREFFIQNSQIPILNQSVLFQLFKKESHLLSDKLESMEKPHRDSMINTWDTPSGLSLNLSGVYISIDLICLRVNDTFYLLNCQLFIFK